MRNRPLPRADAAPMSMLLIGKLERALLEHAHRCATILSASGIWL
jgi:hypothetical protein